MLNKFKTLFTQYWPYLSVCLLITLPWFFQPGYLFFTDMVWGPTMTIQWSATFMPFKVLVKFFSFILPIAFIEKLFITSVCLLISLGAKKVVSQFIENKWLVFSVSLFAIFNPFVYDRAMYGQFGFLAGFGFLILTVGYFIDYLNKKEKKQIIAIGVFSSLAIQFSLHFVFFLCLVYVLFLVVFFRRNKIINYSRLFKHILLIVGMLVVLNLHWLIPLIRGHSDRGNYATQGIEKQDFVVFQTSGKTGVDALKNVLMMSGFWGKDQHRYLDVTSVAGVWGRSFYVLSLLFILGFVYGVKDKKNRVLVLCLVGLFIISTLLATGIRLPIASHLTWWLSEHIPFYNGLRDTQKWGCILVIIYLILLSLGLATLFKNKIVLHNRIMINIIITLIIIMQSPFLLFGFAGQVRGTKYPKDWFEVDQLIVEHDGGCEYQTLVLPWHLYMGFNWIGNVVNNPADEFFTCKVVAGTNMEYGGIYDNSNNQKSNQVISWLRSNGQINSLDELEIKYVLLFKEVDYLQYEWLNELKDYELIKDSDTLKLYVKK